MYRLWFRLDDILPIAEHAMACTTHRTTRAQTLAFARTRPALIWTGSPVMDLLISNGVPVWYREDGDDHVAQAHTWRHTATDRYGTACVHGYHTAYLPLDEAGEGLTVIEVLRDARHTNQHWITIDIDPTDRHYIPASRVRAVNHRDQIVPGDATWVEATVTNTAVDGASYPALVPDGYTTDANFVLPRFDRSTVEQMIADLHAIDTLDVMPGEFPHLQLAGDVVLLIEENDDGARTTCREVDQAHPDAQGRYAIGAYLWEWLRATDLQPRW